MMVITKTRMLLKKKILKSSLILLCECNNCFRELFEKRKKNATLISKTIQNELLSCVRKYILEYEIKRLMKKELLILMW